MYFYPVTLSQIQHLESEVFDIWRGSTHQNTFVLSLTLALWETFPVAWSGTLASPPVKHLLSTPRAFLPSVKLSEKCLFFTLWLLLSFKQTWWSILIIKIKDFFLFLWKQWGGSWRLYAEAVAVYMQAWNLFLSNHLQKEGIENCSFKLEGLLFRF